MTKDNQMAKLNCKIEWLRNIPSNTTYITVGKIKDDSITFDEWLKIEAWSIKLEFYNDNSTEGTICYCIDDNDNNTNRIKLQSGQIVEMYEGKNIRAIVTIL